MTLGQIRTAHPISSIHSEQKQNFSLTKTKTANKDRKLSKKSHLKNYYLSNQSNMQTFVHKVNMSQSHYFLELK